MKCYTTAGVLFAALLVSGAAQAVDINWDGGDGPWNEIPGNWNGGQVSDDVFGRTNGLEVGGAEIGTDVFIGSGNVTYDPSTFGDFRLKGQESTGINPSLNVSGGASFSMDSSAGDIDGNWTQWDGNLHLDNGTFSRTKSGPIQSGGALSFGTWRSYTDQVIEVSLTNGSALNNDGQIWFGAYGDNAVGLAVHMEINGGSSLVNTNGSFSLDDSPGMGNEGGLDFIYGYDGDSMAPKGEDYRVNFTGPGTISVDAAGIRIQDEQADGSYISTMVTYEELWASGILQARGFSGRQGAKFDGFFTTSGTSGSDGYILTSTAAAPVKIVWDGGNGAWNDVSGKWNGGQVSDTVFGRTNGLEIGSGEIGSDININSGEVTYDPSTFGDFRMRAGGTLSINGAGTSLTLDSSAGDIDGNWTQYDGVGLDLAGGSFRRTKSGPIQSGGALTFGSWRSYEGQVIEIDITDGGSLENDGQIWFGAYGDNAVGLEVIMTINNGSVVNTNGSFSLDDSPGMGNEGALDLIYGYDADIGAPKDENYVINFTGSGTISLDAAGIRIQEEQSDGSYISTLASYEDLWDRCILQADGLCGTTPASFSDFFTVSDMPGMDDYILMRSSGVSGDFNGDGAYDCADINALTGEIAAGTNSGTYDLNGDGLVNLDDQTAWLAEGGSANGLPGPYLLGDADLSGSVDVSDFNIFNNSKFTNNTAWCSGNFNGDTGVDVADFNVWNNHKFTSSDVNSVPEPAGLVSLIIAMAGLGLLRRRR